MEESNDTHSEEDNVSPDKNKKRILKTPLQIGALEKFYSEHKYPSELMKSQFARQIGLSEKQVSGWFCHRRLKDKKLLKDKACGNGKQDLSNVFIQDRGSELWQDSCGSTKQGEYGHFDPKEVESERSYCQDYPAAVPASENKSQHMHARRDYGDVDDTSSGSSFASQGGLIPLRSRDSISLRMNMKSPKIRGYMMASRYLYLEDEIENPAISSVERKLGRHYREDGPPVGVEFQPLPPGAFDLPTEVPIHERYYFGDRKLRNARSISRPSRGKNVGPASDRHVLERCPSSLYPEEAGARSQRTTWVSVHQHETTSYPVAQRSSFSSYRSIAPDRDFAMEMDEDSASETSMFSSKNHETGSKHRKDRHICLHDGKITNDLPYPLLRNDNTSTCVLQRIESEVEPANPVQCRESLDAEDTVRSRKKTKVQKICKERKTNKVYGNPARLKTIVKNEMKMVRRTKADESQDYAQDKLWTKPSRGK